jgi:hypothetical protein
MYIIFGPHGLNLQGKGLSNLYSFGPSWFKTCKERNFQMYIVLDPRGLKLQEKGLSNVYSFGPSWFKTARKGTFKCI